MLPAQSAAAGWGDAVTADLLHVSRKDVSLLKHSVGFEPGVLRATERVVWRWKVKVAAARLAQCTLAKDAAKFRALEG